MDKQRQQVVVTDLDISFANLTFLLVKFAFAAIPAIIIIGIISSLLGYVSAALVGALIK